mmetsp:Transcript_21892/g.61531  ORF Transcript_21892/g.61531 Transcript_21892/m.61531 type:complete len:205 (+) Transcript_21892:855-1469(+)
MTDRFFHNFLNSRTAIATYGFDTFGVKYGRALCLTFVLIPNIAFLGNEDARMVHFFKLEHHRRGIHSRNTAGNLTANAKAFSTRASWQMDEDAVRIPVHHLRSPLHRILHQPNGGLQCPSAHLDNTVGEVHTWHAARKGSGSIAIRHVRHEFEGQLAGIQSVKQSRASRPPQAVAGPETFHGLLDHKSSVQNIAQELRKDSHAD